MNESKGYERVLSNKDLILLCLSGIVGAGSMVLIKSIYINGGSFSWLAILLAALFVLGSGFSYAELTSMETFQKNSCEYQYIEYATGSKKIATASSLLIFTSELLIISTIILGFSQCCAAYFPVNITLIAIIAVFLFSFVNFSGIQTSAAFSRKALYIKLFILGSLSIYGLTKFDLTKLVDNDISMNKLSFAGVSSIFMYLGFTSVMNLKEESKEPEKIPQIMLITIIISIIIYFLLILALQFGLNPVEINKSKEPLADLARSFFGTYGANIFKIFVIVGLSDSILQNMIFLSRSISSILSEHIENYKDLDIHPVNKTPYVSITLIACLITIIIIFFSSIEKTGNYSDILTIILFICVNFIAIFLRFNEDPKKPLERNFTMPLNIDKLPIISVATIMLGLFMLYGYFVKI